MNNNTNNYTCSLQQGDEPWLQIPTDLVDPFLSQCLDAPMITSPSSKSSAEPPAADQNKKMVHREAERQRRQEMNSLYTSLRSQLPLEYIKGKRSMSDHMGEAANYIKHLEKRNQELKHKRDKLKRSMSNSSTSDHTVTEGVSGPHFVTVQRCCQGVEIVVRSSLKKSERLVPLSGVLQILSDEGFSAINCVSCTVNERLIHTIQAEVTDAAACDGDICSLQQNLMKFVQSTR